MKREGLTAITIENFKGISDPVTIPLKPVTLMFGANSVGKSTVIQALQYAWEVLEHSNPDVDQTTLGGEVINLGGFRNLVHKHDLGKSIKITLHFRGKICSKDYFIDFWHNDDFFFHTYKGNSDTLSIDMNELVDFQSFSVMITTSWDRDRNEAGIAEYTVFYNDSPFGKIMKCDNDKACLEISGEHPFFTKANMNEYSNRRMYVFELMMEEFLSEYQRSLHTKERLESDWVVLVKAYKTLWDRQGNGDENDFVRYLTSSIQELSNKTIQGFEEKEGVCIAELLGQEAQRKPVQSVIPKWGRLLVINNINCEGPFDGIDTAGLPTEYMENYYENRPDPKDSSARTMIICFLSQLIIGPGEAILNELREMRYTGPLRKIPGREYRPPSRPDRSRWADGQGAWDALLRAEPDDPLVTKCSEYISSTLKLGYTLIRENRVYINANGDLATMLQGDDISTRNEAIKRILAQPKIPFIQLHDMRAGVPVEAMDIGVGVSQVLPVVVGAVEPNCSMFIVEQPELHIHPAVQTNLGDVFLRELLEEGAKPRVFLLETHSEHLVLRIMRRMRETYEDRLPDEFPPVTPDDVAIVLFESIEGRTHVREMPLNKRGDLVKAWPGGFFEEALWETL